MQHALETLKSYELSLGDDLRFEEDENHHVSFNVIKNPSAVIQNKNNGGTCPIDDALFPFSSQKVVQKVNATPPLLPPEIKPKITNKSKRNQDLCNRIKSLKKSISDRQESSYVNSRVEAYQNEQDLAFEKEEAALTSKLETQHSFIDQWDQVLKDLLRIKKIDSNDTNSLQREIDALQQKLVVAVPSRSNTTTPPPITKKTSTFKQDSELQKATAATSTKISRHSRIFNAVSKVLTKHKNDDDDNNNSINTTILLTVIRHKSISMKDLKQDVVVNTTTTTRSDVVRGIYHLVAHGLLSVTKDIVSTPFI